MARGIHFILILLSGLTIPLPLRGQVLHTESLGPSGGTVYSLAMDPHGRLWATIGSRVYRSGDRGETWQFFGWHTGYARIDAGFDDELYAQVDEWAGPYEVSSDGGETWSRLSHLVDDPETDERWSQDLSFLVIDRENRTLFATALGDGVLRSDDAGATWVPISKGLPQEDGHVYAYTLSFHPNGSLFVLLLQGVYRSMDRGESWSQIGEGVLPHDRMRPAGLVITRQGSILASGEYEGVWRSEDEGETWLKVGDDELAYLDVGSVAFGRDDTIYLRNHRRKLFRSTDDGRTWTKLSGVPEDYVSSLTVDVEGGLYIGSFGGVYFSPDQGETWNWRSSGMHSWGISDLLVDFDGELLAGTSYGLLRMSTAQEPWERLTVYGSPRLAKDPGSRLFVADTEGIHVRQALDGIETWAQPIRLIQLDYEWPTALVADDDGRVFVTSTSIYKNKDLYGHSYLSTNGGETWSMHDAPLASAAHILHDGSLILGTEFGAVSTSTDGGVSWSGIGQISDAPVRAFLTVGSEAVLAAVKGPSGGIYRSLDEARVWERVASGPTDVNDMVSVEEVGILALSPSGSVWRSSDGEHFELLGQIDGLSSDAIRIAVDETGRILVGTQWNGVLRTLAPLVTSREADPETPIERFALSQNYPNPFSRTTTIDFELPYPSRVSLDVVDVLGRCVRVLVDEHRAAGKSNVSFDGGDLPSGLYTYRFRAGDVRLQRMMMLVR